MKNFILNANPNFGETQCTIADESGNRAIYKLTQVKGNGCYLEVQDTATGLDKDTIKFSKQDLKALYCLLHVKG